MKLDEFKQVLKTLDIPIAYRTFKRGQEIPTPFLIYFIDETIPFLADDQNYCEFLQIVVELYTDKKDLYLEQQLEQVFFDAQINYEKAELYIDSEDMMETIYYLGGILNGGETKE
ncbi:hypothetical protein [Eremococcus coleocola]|uniref:hypothetical protein n=1 Tax=Eremococcus coleocola TaxID=88132 RepID=UPI00040171E0|nr:hypothetical protein [Eremococcus coleocola]